MNEVDEFKENEVAESKLLEIVGNRVDCKWVIQGGVCMQSGKRLQRLRWEIEKKGFDDNSQKQSWENPDINLILNQKGIRYLERMQKGKVVFSVMLIQAMEAFSIAMW